MNVNNSEHKGRHFLVIVVPSGVNLNIWGARANGKYF